MINDLKIKEYYAYIATDENGNEGLPAADIGGIRCPLVGADMLRMEQLKPYAKDVAEITGRGVKLVKFSKREIIGVVK